MFNFFRNDNSKVINVNDLDDLVGKINLIDIREPYEFKGGSIKGAKNIPMNTLLSDANKYLNKEKLTILYAKLEQEVQWHAGDLQNKVLML